MVAAEASDGGVTGVELAVVAGATASMITVLVEVAVMPAVSVAILLACE